MSVPSQPLLFPLDANCNGVFRHRPVSPNGLLDAPISEEVGQAPGLEEEREAQKPPSGSTARRHTLAEVSTCFSPCAPPCKCPRGPGTWAWSSAPGSSLRLRFPPTRVKCALLAGQLLLTLVQICHLFNPRGHV